MLFNQLTGRIRFVISLFLLTAPLFGQSYTTNFPSPENPLRESGAWQDTQGTLTNCTNGGFPCWYNIKTTNTYAQSAGTTSNTSGVDDATAVLAGTWGPNQTVVIHPKFPSTQGGTQEVEIRLRTTIGNNFIHGYEVDFTLGSTQVVRWNGIGPYQTNGNCGGGGTNCFPLVPITNCPVGTCSGNENSYKWTSGDVLSASITGTSSAVINVYVNGVLQFTATDSNSPYTTGNPGFGIDINSVTANTNFGIMSFTATATGGGPQPPSGLTVTVK
jgi:hypothetical protein